MNNYNNEEFNSINSQQNKVEISNAFQQSMQSQNLSNHYENSKKTKLPLIIGILVILVMVSLGIFVATRIIGKKTLVCTLNYNIDGIVTTNKKSIDFKNKYAYRLEGNMNVDFTSFEGYLEIWKDDFFDEYQKWVDNLKSEGIQATINYSEKEVNISYIAEADKFDVLSLNKDDDYENMKAFLEKEKYICEK